MAALEGGTRGFAFASGLAAEDTLLRTIGRPAATWCCRTTRTAGSFRLFAKVYDKWGLHVDSVSLVDLAAVEAAITPGGDLRVWVETPTNPLLNVADIAAIAELAHAAGRPGGGGQHVRLAPTCSSRSSSAPTWWCTRPPSTAADTPTSSGARSSSRTTTWPSRSRFHQNAMGAVASPFDSWLVLRGLQDVGGTDGPAQRQRGAGRGLPGRASGGDRGLLPGSGQPSGPRPGQAPDAPSGGMVSFRVRGGEQAALDVCARTKVIILGESLGGVESLIEHPGRMTHASVSGTARRSPGPDPAQRRHRGPGRPHRRPRPGPCAGALVEGLSSVRHPLARSGTLCTRCPTGRKGA